MEYDDAHALVRSLHIRNKFEQIGHPEYLSLMARAMAQFSLLALSYSPLAEKPRWVLKALEVNPFAISADGRFVALDGLAELAPAPPPTSGTRASTGRTWTRSSGPTGSRWSECRRIGPSTAWRATSRSCCTSCTARTCTS